uniref:Low density lipoprotein receptor class A cysteine rich n=1 Tax=Echinococcus granulosus TaxID=6210 RepID=A0A068X3L0_ECHGR|nr:Low density lipoprotein receptor class A cysteine rich [Echinococcus granulosus]
MLIIITQIFVFCVPVFSRYCDKDFDIRLNTIILTRISENRGAEFVHKLSADSLEECVKYCCDLNECTVGVFGPKGGGNCFLFNCHKTNLCNFTSESDYTVFIQRTPLPVPPNVHKVVAWPSGSLHGLCGPRNPCVFKNMICDSEHCVCKAGFIEKRRKCAPSICSKPELEFQCDDATTCIAIYDVCNGIAECSDASDELFCEKELSNSIATYKVKSSISPGAHFLNAQTFPPRGDDEHDLSGIGFEPLKVRSLRTLRFGRNNPMPRNYEDKGEYGSPNYLISSLEPDVPSLMPSEARERSILSDDGVSTFLKRPRGGYLSHFLEDSQYSDEDSPLEHHRREIVHLPTRPRHASVENFDGEAGEHDILHHRGADFDRAHKVLRHRVTPLAEHLGKFFPSNLYLMSDDKHRIGRHHEEAKNSSKRPKAPTDTVIGPYSQSGYQWHTAAILLAIGLGLTSCLFGLLVGRCRQRGRFDQGGPRSKAVATSNLRRRILRTRGLPNNDLERSGLLSKLQL